MTSRLRLDPANGWHHITCHRIEDGNLFEDDSDRWLLLRLLVQASEKFGVQIVSYSLMGNHYHLVLHCPHGQLSRFMHHVNGVYARTYNRRHGRSGPLFTDNFFSGLITDDGQLIFTTRYVDRNALELGFDIRTYPWASYPAYLRADELVSVVPLHAETPLKLVGGPAAYRHFVETDNPADKFSIRHGRATVVAKAHQPPQQVLAALLDVCSNAATHLSGTQAALGRRARSAAVLLAHELAIGHGEETRRFFGFRSASAHASFLYRAQRSAEADPAFVNQVRTRWFAQQQFCRPTG